MLNEANRMKTPHAGPLKPKDASSHGREPLDPRGITASAAIRGAMDLEVDLREAGKAVMIKVLRDTDDPGGQALESVSHIAQVAIRTAARLGGNVEAATLGLIEGAVHHATETGLRTGSAAAAAADGALQAAWEEGWAAVGAVRGALARFVKKASLPGCRQNKRRLPTRPAAVVRTNRGSSAAFPHRGRNWSGRSRG
jgi:hypothetical protein